MTREHVVVCTTLPAQFMDDPDTWGAWLYTAEELNHETPVKVSFFAALEMDARGIEPFEPIIERLREIGGDYWTFVLDDGRTELTTANRLRHLTMGQNLAVDYCVTVGADWMLFLAADMEPPAETIPKLLALDHPFVGGEVTTYCLSGPEPRLSRTEQVDGVYRFHDGGPLYPDFPVEEHMPTAAFVMVARSLFNRLRWRWDAEQGWSDDPCFWHDAKDLHGVTAYVRKDVVGKHYPEAIPRIEERGHDLTVHRV